MKIVSASVDINKMCNLNCSTCYNCSGLNLKEDEMSCNEIRQIIDTLIPFNLKNLILSGGEPMLHSEFNKILDLADKYPEIDLYLSTNGTIYNEKLFKKLSETNNLFIKISLDGSNEKYNFRTRGLGNYGKTVDFIKQIVSPVNKPIIKMVISQRNYDNVEDFYRFVINLGCVPEFAFIFKRGNGADNWESKILSPHQKVNALKLLEHLNSETGIKAFLHNCTDSCPYISELENMSVFIDTKGYIRPCLMLFEKEYRLGNTIYFNEDKFYDKIIKMHSLAIKRTQMDYGCKNCIFKITCSKGCMANALLLHNGIYTEDGDCEFRRLKLLEHVTQY